MAKGRKPNALAASHGAPLQVQAAPIDSEEGGGLAMPSSVAMLPEAASCWDVVAKGQTRFREQELPLLEQYCIAYAAARQALGNLAMEGDGTLAVVVQTPGTMPKKNPNWTVWREAVDTMRHLSGVLGLDTLTAERLNLTRTATASIAADLPAKIRAAAREALDGRG